MKNTRALVILLVLGFISFYAVKSGARAWQWYKGGKPASKPPASVNSGPASMPSAVVQAADPVSDPELRINGVSRSGRHWQVLRHDGKSIEWNVPDEFGWPERLFFSGGRGFIIYRRDGGKPYRVLLFTSLSTEQNIAPEKPVLATAH